MRSVPLWKVLFFIFIVLPVFLFLFIVFFIPLILILLLVMPLMAKRFAFRAKHFGKGVFHREDVDETAARYDSGNGSGDIVDVEGVVVSSSPEDENGEKEAASGSRLLPPH